MKPGVMDTDFRRYWIFQGMPDRYDLEERLKAGESERWPLSRYRGDIHPGDVVYFWRGGRRPGLYGWGVILDQGEGWVAEKADGDVLAPVEYQVRFREPLPKDELLKLDEETGALAGLLILRAPQGTNFKVTCFEARALNAILRRRDEEPPPDPVGTDADEWPARSLLPLTFGRSTARVVGTALTPTVDLVTGVSLFNILMALPYTEHAPPRGAVSFLREFFSEGKFDPGSLVGAIAHPVALTWEALADARVSADALGIVEAARLLAIHSTGSEEIGVRHLLGGLLLAGGGGLLAVIEADCVRSGRKIEEFVEAFTTFTVESFAKDDSSTWLSRWKPVVLDRLRDFQFQRSQKATESFDMGAEVSAGTEFPPEPETKQPPESERLTPGPTPETAPVPESVSVLETTKAFARVFARRPLTDRPLGHDLLRIQQEVSALAHLFALCDGLAEPENDETERDRATFALGLFGRWGAGKSFFIDKMKKQIDAYSTQARTGTGGPPYCKQIVQIDFNAWHYNEADIWASLVHHIFDTLQKHFAAQSQEQEFKNLIGRLEISQQQREEIERDRRTKRKQRRLVACAIAKNQQQIDANVEAQMSRIGVLGRVAASPELRKTLTDVLAQAQTVLGLPASVNQATLTTATDSAQELLDALQESGALAMRAQSTGRSLLQSAFTRGFFIIVGITLVCYVGIPIWAQKPDLWNDLFSGITQGVIAALPVLGWVATKLKQTHGVFDKITGIESTLREQIRQDEERKSAELETLRVTHARLETELDDGAKRLAVIDDEIRGIEAKLDELGSPESLVDFINDRASSDDYRSKLGILALIRSDFEKLSKLMTGKHKPALRRSEGETEIDEDRPLPHLDRIILYIDDLDRVQQSGKVLQVLEAVHLLLAFPLFHVVVAVDERWAARSVLQHHKAFFELRENDGNPKPTATAPAKTGKGKSAAQAPSVDPGAVLQEYLAGTQSATPREFLEKIFQICFWVRPLSTQLTHELINGMVRGDTPPTKPEEAIAADRIAETNRQTANDKPADVETPNDLPATELSADAESAAGVELVQNQVGTPAAGTPAAIEEEGHAANENEDTTTDENDLNESVSTVASESSVNTGSDAALVVPDYAISEEELISMRALSRVIGRSPRTVKRFINTYRLFKAMRIPPGTGAALGETFGPDEIAAQHVPIMILLAIQIGHPDVAFGLFNAFDSALEADDTQSIGQVIKRLEQAVPDDVTREKWLAALDSFHSVHDLWGEDPTLIDLGIAVLDPWLLGTSRFGFKEWIPQAERLWGVMPP